MPTIVYLDADDEITSAASRIRQAADRRVALVIPFGSRVATSRINFRLLAREAMANGRRLDIVAPDASARALAASAGLPVFGSVGEYEEALDAPEDVGPGPAADDRPATGGARDGGGGGVPRGAAAAASAGLAAGIPRAGAPDAPVPAGTVAASDVRRRTEHHDEAGHTELETAPHRGRDVPVARAPRRRPGARLIVGALVLLVALVAAAIAGVLFLPAAEIAVTPRIQPVGPVELTVTADPSATAVDEAGRVIPAQVVPVPVEVSGSFPATGRRVERTPATGDVRWRNCDNSAAYTIPAGTVVATRDGTEFRLDEAVFLPVAAVSGSGATLELRCQSNNGPVTAVKPGPDGNVAAGAIAVIPPRYNRNLITVTNPAPTEGGTRVEFTRISQDDVDAAMAQLEADLDAQFEADLEAPPGVPAGATVFPDTGELGEGAWTLDPATLVDQEVEAFELGLTATGTVLAVDASPVETIASGALAAAVDPGYELVEGSTRVVVGDGSVEDGVVVFRVAGVARQVRPVDGEGLREAVLGLPAAEARALLEPYGDVELVLWPGFVDTVPTWPQRVTVVVREPVDGNPVEEPVPATPPPAAVSPEPLLTPVADPSAGGDPAQPLPSG